MSEQRTTNEAAITDEAVEVVGGRGEEQLWMITCEHASQALPEGTSFPDADARLVDTHWAYDLGAKEIALELGGLLSATVVSSRYSRLLVDVNRPEDSDTLFRELAEGAPVALNQGLSEAERTRRITRYLRPYHARLDAEVAASRAPMLCSVHSFTPLYEGEPRSLEVGVLYNLDEALATDLAEGFAKAGIRVELNEPYSGKEGLMYSVDRHARAHGRQAVELEIRQDLAVDATFRRDFLPLLASLLTRVGASALR